MRIQLVCFDLNYLEHSWHWLNDAEIHKLTNCPKITRKSQKEWFNNLKRKDDYIIWGIELDSVPIGACGLKKITDSDCEYWGYVGEKQYWGKGLGSEMINLLEEKARKLGKSTIWLKVIKENMRAITLYKKQGFITESELDSLYVMRKQL
jgi:RimJ/RimL family protein N-acetyltransferase